MPLKQILAENLNALMKQTMGMDTNEKVHARSGIGRGTIDRLRKYEVSTTLDTVDQLAEAFSVSPLALLSPPGAEAVAPLPLRQDDSKTRIDRLSAEEDLWVQTLRAMDKPERAQLLEISAVMARASRAAANEP